MSKQPDNKKAQQPPKSQPAKDEKKSSKKIDPVQDDIVQPKHDEQQTQEAAKANAQKGEPVHTELGSKTLDHGINADLSGEK